VKKKIHTYIFHVVHFSPLLQKTEFLVVLVNSNAEKRRLKKCLPRWSGNVTVWSGIVAVWSGNVAVAKSNYLEQSKNAVPQKKVVLSENLFFEQKAEI